MFKLLLAISMILVSYVITLSAAVSFGPAGAIVSVLVLPSLMGNVYDGISFLIFD